MPSRLHADKMFITIPSQLQAKPEETHAKRLPCAPIPSDCGIPDMHEVCIEQRTDLSHAVMQLWPRQCTAISKPYSTARNTMLLQCRSSSRYATNKLENCCFLSKRLRNQDFSSGHHLPAPRSVLTLRDGRLRPARENGIGGGLGFSIAGVFDV